MYVNVLLVNATLKIIFCAWNSRQVKFASVNLVSSSGFCRSDYDSFQYEWHFVFLVTHLNVDYLELTDIQITGKRSSEANYRKFFRWYIDNINLESPQKFYLFVGCLSGSPEVAGRPLISKNLGDKTCPENNLKLVYTFTDIHATSL